MMHPGKEEEEEEAMLSIWDDYQSPLSESHWIMNDWTDRRMDSRTLLVSYRDKWTHLVKRFSKNENWSKFM